jgi:phage protein D/phage baseplate assembly protein gpV
VKPATGIGLFTIEIDGVPVEAGLARSITDIRVRQRLSLPTMCEITFNDPPQTGSDTAIASAGASLRVAARDGGSLFVGEITAVEFGYDGAIGQTIRLRGYDRLHRLSKRQPIKNHVQVSAADLARELTADAGLSVSADIAGPVWPRVVQYGQTDMELLTELAGRAGLAFTLRDETLHLLTLEGIGDVLPLVVGDTLLEAQIELNGAAAVRSVAAAAWDPLRDAAHHGSATSARTGRDVSASIDPDRIGGSGERVLLDELAPADDMADAFAQAELDVRSAREVVLRGVAEGDPRLLPGTIVEVSGVAGPVAGRYVLAEVTHRIDDQRGFVTELSTAPPPLPVRTRGAAVTPAVVTSVDDPDGLGRVRATLPTYDDLETDWMGVLTVGAGSGKGLVMLPDVGDHVLVLFARGDPAQGLVLGGLYGSTAPPDKAGVASGQVRRASFMTPGGQVLRLDDTRHSVRVENQDGSYVEMAPGGVVIHAATDLTLEAPGHAVVVRGKTVDFQQA